MTDRAPLDSDRAILAAEYALDLADGDRLAEAQRLLQTDGLFAAEVARWEQEFAGWLKDSHDAPPPEHLWERIISSVGRASSSRPRGRENLASPRRWQITALAASLAAAGFASLWIFELRSHSPDSRSETVAMTAESPLDTIRFASIDSAKDQQIVAAVYDRATGRFVARLAALDTRGQMPELWLIGSDGQPKSLGPAEAGRTLSITLPPEMRSQFADGATIAISLEAPSAKPHAAPSGPILGTAKISGI